VAAAPAARRAYAGLVSRVAALGVDVGLLTMATLAVGTLPGLAWHQLTPFEGIPGWLTAASATAAALLPLAYFTLCWWLTGQTVGALLTGIEVVNRRGEGLSFPHAVLRAAGGLLFAPLWLVGLLLVPWDGHRRACHDLVFRTEVRYAVPARTRR